MATAPAPAPVPTRYPQYGVNQAHKIITARSSAQKQADIDAGYMEWFQTRTAARNWVKGQQGILGGHLPDPLSGLDSLAGRLEEGSTWIRAGEAALGIILIAIGVARITRAVPIATDIAKTAGATAI